MLTLSQVIATAKSKGYLIDTRPYALNIIGVRNSNATDQTTFDDSIAYFYYNDNGVVIGKVAPATTDPSAFFLQNPINPQGTGILKSGQYVNAYSIGLHRGKYEAVVQTKPVTTIRDSDRNALINYFAPTTKGLYGINIHHATVGKANTRLIDKDSAGCQVFRDISDFDQMMQYAKVSSQKYGNNFTYTLIDERDTFKTFNTAALGFALIGLSIYLFIRAKRKK